MPTAAADRDTAAESAQCRYRLRTSRGTVRRCQLTAHPQRQPAHLRISHCSEAVAVDLAQDPHRLLGTAGGCSGCLLAPLPLDGAASAVVYDGLARSFLLRAKLGGRPEILPALGRQLAEMLALGAPAGLTAVVPVPAHPWVRLRRGFDPAREVARPVARALGLPVRRRWLRRRWTGPRAVKRLGAGERTRALSAAFVASRRCEGQRILLVDDVMTTGATASACARSLRRAGASAVWVATWARTPWRGPERFDRQRTGLL